MVAFPICDRTATALERVSTMGNKRFEFRGFKKPEDNAAWHSAVGAAIYKWRRKRGLSQQALADRTSATRGQVSKYELGNASPKAEHLIEIAQALQITIFDLQPNMVSTYPLSPDENYNLLLRKTEAVIGEVRELQRLAKAVYANRADIADHAKTNLETTEEIARRRYLDADDEQ